MNLKILAIVFAVIIIILLGVFFFIKPVHGPTIPPDNNASSKTEPQSAVSADGRLTVLSPRAGDLVASPLTIAGQVTGGGWFFEASFPVRVVDGDGTVIGGGQAKAQADWMTTSSVPFIAVASFTAPRYATGTVVLWKDNPSGLPENDASFTIPVKFK
jgi:hypothetical protein